MEDDVIENPGSLIDGPEGESYGEHCPETAFLVRAVESVGRCNDRSCKHGEKAGEICEGCEAQAGVSGHRHDGIGESNPGRCDKPTVTLKRTHPTPFYESQTGIPRTVWEHGGYFRYTS